jgi:hypothetical protein
VGATLTGLVGAVNIPFYEEMALYTKWWRYTGCRMVGHTPYYIIVGEFLILTTVPILSRWADLARPVRTIMLGIAMGLAMFPLYGIPWWLIDART